MLFHSIEFLVFLSIVFPLYWFVFQKNVHARNIFLIVCSYVFYGWWDWRFLSLIILSSGVDFLVGIGLARCHSTFRRRLYLWLSIGVNLGALGFFKYCDFFIDSFVTLMTSLGMEAHPTSLAIILPVGISFYTFQTLSYTIDVYRRKMEATHDLFAFFAFVSFFPQLVAGPIERATRFLPRFFETRSFNPSLATDGVRQILWGLFKKIVVADTCGHYADMIFNGSALLPGSVLMMGVVYFAFQIYGDFSGYSDIAIGTGKLFGFNLMKNFSLPYFSRNVAEFWHRWHISLSSWFRDYVYIPLGGNRCGKARQLCNILITFTISGFWHGANWTFVVWGFINGLFFIPSIFREKKQHNDIVGGHHLLPSLREFGQMFMTFFFILVTWVFFRSDSVPDALFYIDSMLSWDMLTVPRLYRAGLIWIGILILVEWFQRHQDHALHLSHCPRWMRWTIYQGVVICILACYREQQMFIYFQF